MKRILLFCLLALTLQVSLAQTPNALNLSVYRGNRFARVFALPAALPLPTTYLAKVYEYPGGSLLPPTQQPTLSLAGRELTLTYPNPARMPEKAFHQIFFDGVVVWSGELAATYTIKNSVPLTFNAVQVDVPFSGDVITLAARDKVLRVVDSIRGNVDLTDANRLSASASATLASQKAAQALASEQAAQASRISAATSETNAASSASSAGSSKTSATNSQTAAAASAASALVSKTSAATSETNAAGSATSANSSRISAATSETNAATSAASALGGATSAAASAADSYTSAQSAASSASSANSSKTSATNSQTAAAASAASALSSKTSAATSETNAAGSATAAAASASAAATSVYNYTVNLGNLSTTATINLALADNIYAYGTLTGNTTLTINGVAPGKSLYLELVQGGAGGFTATFPSTVRFPGAASIDWNTTAGSYNVFTLVGRPLQGTYNLTGFYAKQ